MTPVAEIRLTVPEPGVPYEIGQEISVNAGDPTNLHEGIILEIIDIGIRVGLVLQVPDDSPLADISDSWIESLQETL